VGILLQLLAVQKITVRDVEEAAAPTRTNGSAASDPQPAIADPELEPRVSVPTIDSEPAPPKSAVRASLPAMTTAEKVCALASGARRWRCGDPRHLVFIFCGAPAAKGPYCEVHRTLPHMTLHEHGVAPGCRPRSKQAPISASPPPAPAC